MSGRQEPGTRSPCERLPLDLPFATDQEPASAQVSASERRPAGTNTSVPAVPGASRISRQQLDRLIQRMPERDREVLTRLNQHRYLSAHQIRRFAFTDHATEDSAARSARYVTTRLAKASLIRPLERRVGGVRPGSEATIWQLAPAGMRLLRADAANSRTHEPSPRFLRHCLAVADVHLGLRDLGAQPEIDNVLVETEPDCWRSFQAPSGEQRWLQPDLYARLTSSDYIDRWFIEVDLGTESLPTLMQKCERFQSYLDGGAEQAAHGNFPLVLWVFQDAGRAVELERRVLRSRTLIGAMFRYATLDAFTELVETGG